MCYRSLSRTTKLTKYLSETLMRPLLANLLLSKSSDVAMGDTAPTSKTSSPLSFIHTPAAVTPSSDNTSHPFPALMQWLAPAQLGIAFLALGLQLMVATGQNSSHPVVHVAAPLLFLVAGVSSLVAHRGPGPFAASAVGTTSILSGLAAAIVLLGPAFGIRLPSGNAVPIATTSSFQEVTSTVYVFMCLAEGVVSFVMATVAIRFANNLDPKVPPVIVYVHPTSSNASTSATGASSPTSSSPVSIIPQPPPLNNFVCRRQSNEYVSLPIVKKETPITTEIQESNKNNDNLKFPSLEFSEC